MDFFFALILTNGAKQAKKLRVISTNSNMPFFKREKIILFIFIPRITTKKERRQDKNKMNKIIFLTKVKCCRVYCRIFYGISNGVINTYTYAMMTK